MEQFWVIKVQYMVVRIEGTQSLRAWEMDAEGEGSKGTGSVTLECHGGRG